MIQDLVTRNGDFESTDEHQVYNRLEGNIEWSEFDEVVQHVSDDLSEYSFLYFHFLDMFFRSVITFEKQKKRPNKLEAETLISFPKHSALC